MPTTEELLDTFKNMTVLELNEFLKAFEEEFGVTAAAPVAVAAAAGGGGGGEAAAAEEKDEFDVVLDRRGRQEDPGHQGGPVRSRASGSKRPRTWSTRPRSPSSRRSPRKRPRRPRASSKRPAPPSSSSSTAALRPRSNPTAGRRRLSAIGGRSRMQCLTPVGGRRILPTVPATPLGVGPLRLHCVARRAPL